MLDCWKIWMRPGSAWSVNVRLLKNMNANCDFAKQLSSWVTRRAVSCVIPIFFSTQLWGGRGEGTVKADFFRSFSLTLTPIHWIFFFTFARYHAIVFGGEVGAWENYFIRYFWTIPCNLVQNCFEIFFYLEENNFHVFLH